MYTIRIHGHSMDQFERCKCSQRDQVTWGIEENSTSIFSDGILVTFDSFNSCFASFLQSKTSWDGQINHIVDNFCS